MCYLTCGVDLLKTCLSQMISTFTSEQTFFICRQRLGTFEQCPRSAAWTPAVRQPVKLQKEAIQALLAIQYTACVSQKTVEAEINGFIWR